MHKAPVWHDFRILVSWPPLHFQKLQKPGENRIYQGKILKNGGHKWNRMNGIQVARDVHTTLREKCDTLLRGRSCCCIFSTGWGDTGPPIPPVSSALPARDQGLGNDFKVCVGEEGTATTKIPTPKFKLLLRVRLRNFEDAYSEQEEHFSVKVKGCHPSSQNWSWRATALAIGSRRIYFSVGHAPRVPKLGYPKNGKLWVWPTIFRKGPKFINGEKCFLLARGPMPRAIKTNGIFWSITGPF